MVTVADGGLFSILLRYLVAQPSMQSLGVVFDPPAIGHLASMRNVNEPVFIQVSIAEVTIEAFQIVVLDWLAKPDERQPHTTQVRPQRPACGPRIAVAP